ncbi:unnamed protein product [Nesidiocoris tenuis]|uniref:Uncharacterized protein n=1 Tax=Nesidiocoris tenuis TaxID=355587 RepID=A0A6H5H7N5_9HEMI|nr:unnamed protein product [Nesidiocoris tenuis]
MVERHLRGLSTVVLGSLNQQPLGGIRVDARMERSPRGHSNLEGESQLAMLPGSSIKWYLLYYNEHSICSRSGTSE